MPRLIHPSTHTSSAVFAPLEGAGRAGLVEKRLTDAIVPGVLEHGDRLPREADLAQSLGVATVTAREALESLRDKSLIRTVRGSGSGSGSFFIRHPDDKTRIENARILEVSRGDLRDIGVHYSIIGAGAAERAAEHASIDDVENLRRMVGITEFAEESSTRRSEMNFHLELAAFSLSARLVHEEIRFQAEIGPILWMSMQDDACRASSRDARLQIVQAIGDVDGEAAQRLTTGQIAATVEWLIDAKSKLETACHAA